MADHTVAFLAVGKLTSHKVVASYLHDRGASEDFHAQITKLMGSSSIGATVPNELHLKNGAHTIHVQVDKKNHVFIAITSSSYPRRLVFAAGEAPSLMRELGQHFTERFERDFRGCERADGLTKAALSMLRRIADKYSDVTKLDKLAKVQADIRDVQDVVQDNISKVLDRGEKIDAIEGKTDTLVHSAGMFSKRATTVRRTIQCRYYKLQALCILLVLIILLYILLPFITDLF